MKQVLEIARLGSELSDCQFGDTPLSNRAAAPAGGALTRLPILGRPARLDRSKLPLGYVMGEAAGGFIWRAGRENGKVYMTPDGALQSAWEHCETENDPPGMWLGRSVSEDGSRETWSFGVGDEARPVQSDLPSRGQALATAWAYYWRRVELVRRMEALSDPRYRLQAPAAWPEVLTWSAEQVTQVEKDLAEAEAAEKARAEAPANVHQLGRPSPDQRIVEYLEGLLERARAGEVSSLACAAVLTSRRTLRHYVIGETGLECAALVGLVEQVKHDIMREGSTNATNEGGAEC